MSRKYSSSKGNHNFATTPDANIKRSTFDRSHGIKTTFNASKLIPIYVDEALPGDTFKLSMTAFARIATPLKPIMDNMVLESFFFAVPNRLLWDNWEKFCGFQENPGDSTDFTIPVLTGEIDPDTVVEEGDILDYMGLPLDFPVQASQNISALPVLAYYKIWNEWFRDENFMNSVPLVTDGTPVNIVTIGRKPATRGKRKDYFTGCLPWPQKGAAVDLPLGTTAPVVTDSTTTLWDNGGTPTPFTAGTGGSVGLVGEGSGNPGANFAFGSNTGLEVDLTNATAATINSLREAFQTQRLLERDARGGTRYTEVIRAHFNVTSPDFRLQRPEYLGGGRTYINFQSVPATIENFSGSVPQGNLAAYGTAAAMNHGFTQSFTEHMTLIGMVMVRADLTYQQGINRMWLRQTRYDFFWPALAHLGEQEVFSKEIYADGTAADLDIFGYQERYAEYRYKPSMITGQFRSTFTTPLDIWHLAQEFGARPVLNEDFIEENVPVDRIKAVIGEPDFIMDAQINLKCARPMPVYGIPGYIDHF